MNIETLLMLLGDKEVTIFTLQQEIAKLKARNKQLETLPKEKEQPKE